MQTSNKARTILFLLVTAFCSLFIFSCFSPWQGSGGSLTISIGGGNSRATVVGVGGKADSSELLHKIIITDSAGAVQEAEIPAGGGTAYFSSVALGPCTIIVQGWKDNEVLTEGTSRVNIEPGPNSTVPIKMETAPVQKMAGFILNLNSLQQFGNQLTVEVNGSVVTVSGSKSENIELDIPSGVTVRWSAKHDQSIGGYAFTLKGSGTLEFIGDVFIYNGGYGGAIFIESGSPTLKISCDPLVSMGDRWGINATISTAPGSSPNIVISSGSVGRIELSGGGTITVSGNGIMMDKNEIRRVGNAAVKGYYGFGIIDNAALGSSDPNFPIRDVFHSSWTEGVNLFRIP
jgi:hypothetical protein